ncbi:MAG: ABC transporter ATP-binding protein [Proteobacteria bacterium]|nr:ABC transporter ATP-binding protein [Pseudomonadota bacterium]
MYGQFIKCITLLERKTAWQAGLVAVLVLIAAVLEAFGIGLVFAFVNVLVDPSQIEKISWIGKLIGPVIAEKGNGFLIFLALGLLATFIAKNIILLGFYYAQSRFVNTNAAMLATRLLDGYLKGAYSLHLSRNSAEFIRNLNDAVNAVFNTVIMGFINLASETVLIIALMTVLLLVEPQLTLGAIVLLSAAVAVFFTFSKSRFAAWGELEQTSAGKILQTLQQGFHSIKEVKILGRQSFILESFKAHRNELSRILTKVGTMTNAPRLWVETVIVSAVLVVVVIILSSGGNSAKILSTLTLFAAASFRMIPSMNRVLIALNGIKNGAHAVNLVYQDLHDFQGAPDEDTGDDSGDDGPALPFGETLLLEGVSFSYAGADGGVLKNINLNLAKGGSLGLVGPSGAGKTTLVDIILGLLLPKTGRVTVDGTDISTATRAWRRQIGYVPQSIYIIDDSLRRNIAFGLNDDEIDEAKIQKAIRLAQLNDLVGELPDGLETRLGERGVRLSGGQRQRVGIARALYRDPEVLILDEATSSLDAETEHEINNAIDRLSGEKTLIIIAHRLSTVRKCQSLAFIKDGNLVDTGGFEELRARNADFGRMVELSQL